jgi:hypothetical protein
MKCDVYFLWPAPQPGHRGPAPLARRARAAGRSRQAVESPLRKIVGTPVHEQMTARNINTVRKLVELADTDASARG